MPQVDLSSALLIELTEVLLNDGDRLAGDLEGNSLV